MDRYRIGQGFDIHKLVAGRKLILGGIEVPFDRGFEAHSDGDVLIHSIIDSILGALALGDIGKFFPDTDEKYKDIDSTILLKEIKNLLDEHKYKIVNLDTTIKAEKPKLREYIDIIRNNLANILDTDIEKISVKAKTMEKLGYIGECNAIESDSVVLLEQV